MKNVMMATILGVAMLAGGFVLSMVGSVAAHAGTATHGVAVQGYDVVAYFTEDKAVRGDTSIISHDEDGKAYLFSSEENLKKFKENPSKYKPAFGGYCAMGVAMGKKFSVDPESFAVVDGKLYLNLNPKVKEFWSTDIPGNLEKANTNWPNIINIHASQL